MNTRQMTIKELHSVSSETIKQKLILKDEANIDKAIDLIEKSVRENVPSIDTKEGREELRSLAFSVKRSRTAIEKAVKDIKSDLNKKGKEIAAKGKAAAERLDALHDEIRAPLTEYEENEKRFFNNVARIANLRAPLDANGNMLSVGDLERNLEELESIDLSCKQVTAEDLEEAEKERARTRVVISNLIKTAQMLEREEEKRLEEAAAKAKRGLEADPNPFSLGSASTADEAAAVRMRLAEESEPTNAEAGKRIASLAADEILALMPRSNNAMETQVVIFVVQLALEGRLKHLKLV